MKRLALAFPLAAALLSLYSCRSMKYVPVETVRTEYRYRDSLRRDSIHVTDSIRLWTAGDTVYKHSVRTEYRYLFSSRTDTVARRDTVRVPYPVERELSARKKLGMYAAGAGIGVLAAGAVAAVIWLRRRGRG